MISYFTYIIIISHVHPTVKHYVFASNGHKDATAAHILTSTLEREQQSCDKNTKKTLG